MLLWHNMSLYLPRQAQDTLGYPDKLRTPMQYEHTENRKMIINNISGSQFKNCAHETATREEEQEDYCTGAQGTGRKSHSDECSSCSRALEQHRGGAWVFRGVAGQAHLTCQYRQCRTVVLTQATLCVCEASLDSPNAYRLLTCQCIRRSVQLPCLIHCQLSRDRFISAAN
jgi:hypothetical protein